MDEWKKTAIATANFITCNLDDLHSEPFDLILKACVFAFLTWVVQKLERDPKPKD